MSKDIVGGLSVTTNHEPVMCSDDGMAFFVGCSCGWRARTPNSLTDRRWSSHVPGSYLTMTVDDNLDAERLARALHGAAVGCLRPISLSRKVCVPTARAGAFHNDQAAAVAAAWRVFAAAPQEAKRHGVVASNRNRPLPRFRG